MDQHERERGRTSRASSTSSLGREVRCACQFFQSDSLLPERRAMNVTRPSSRNAVAQPAITSLRGTSEDAAATPETHREHEYEPIGTPLVNPRTMTPVPAAPVVRIIDTDVAPVADSDESIDLRGRFTPGPILEGNELILPLDGQIEDSAMETRELAGAGDTSEELESPQQLQDRIEERFLNSATPCTESRTDGEVNTSQVDSSAMEELPLRRGARGLPQRLRSQAGKLRSRIKSIQRPNFSLSIDRLRAEKTKSSSEKSRGSSEKTKSGSDRRSTASERARNTSIEKKSPRTMEKRTRMDRIRSSLPDRPRISLPERPRFNFPDRSKFHLPERPRFNIKKPNIRFPTLGKSRGTKSSLGEVQRRSNESSTGSKRNIFDFSTYPRLFDRKSKNNEADYATSSPKESRAQSTESSTLPRMKKTTKTTTAVLGPEWSQKFTDIKFADDDENDEPVTTLAERSKPWRRPSNEEPRVSLRPQESIEEPESLPWEDSEERGRNQQIEELPYEDDEDDEPEEEINRGRALKLIRHALEDSYEEEPPRIDPRLYDHQDIHPDDQDLEDTRESMREEETYRGAFIPVDPRYYEKRNLNETEIGELEVGEEEDEPVSSGMEEDISARSDREQQQSSGSSCDRRRRGVIEEIDSDEFFLREKGISQDDMNVGRYLTSEIRDALRTPENALAHEIIIVAPPRRPARTRSMRKQQLQQQQQQRKETSVESYDIVAPIRPKRDNQRRSMDVDYIGEPDNINEDVKSRHRIVYHAESAPLDLGRIEPLDDIVVVKPIRRKASLRSQSLRRSDSLLGPQVEETTRREEETRVKPPSAPPRRRKRPRDEQESIDQVPRVNGVDVCNGHHSPVSNEPEERIKKVTAPKKPERAASRETLKSLTSVMRIEYTESAPPPVPPKRSSRSRGASIVPDDDKTSHGAESIPEIDYDEEEIPRDESILDYPGYAMIEKREKPPRPPPPRKRRDEKFATTPRASKQQVPSRPQRAYSTLRPARSRTPSEVTSVAPREILDATAYEELDSDDDQRDLVVSKIQRRPLPPPPRPPRSRRDRNDEDNEQQPREGTSGMSEAFASTQTDPLPEDMVIEEEQITQAKLIVSPSRSGSQILVSTERVPSPTSCLIAGTRSQHPVERETDPNGLEYAILKRSESPERTVSRTFERARKTPSPVRRAATPTVPPLPAQKSLYRDDLDDNLEDRERSPSVPREREAEDDYYDNDDDDVDDVDDEREVETRLRSSLSERIRLEEELEEARNFRSAIMSNEPFKIASLEVTDLRVDRLNVTTLEAHKITASEIDALVVSATELSNTGERSEQKVDLHPTLLRELIAIRSQLELVNSSQPEAPRELTIERVEREIKREEAGRIGEIAYSSVQQPAHLQLDQVSRTTETRAIFSSVGSSRESSPRPATTGLPTGIEASSKKPESGVKDETIRSETRSRSSSPGRTGSPTSLRQTASPVKSLPPVISVTPDTPDVIHSRVESSEISAPQRAILSYVRDEELSSESLRERTRSSQRPSSPSPPPSASIVAPNTRFVAFSTSQIPPEFFSLASPARTVQQEPGIVDLGQQLFRALRVATKRAMRHFVGYIVNRIGHEETDTKMREVELALCALLLIIAGLLIVCFGGPRTITHHHHWDYFNPPRL